MEIILCFLKNQGGGIKFRKLLEFDSNEDLKKKLKKMEIRVIKRLDAAEKKPIHGGRLEVNDINPYITIKSGSYAPIAKKGKTTQMLTAIQGLSDTSSLTSLSPFSE